MSRARRAKRRPSLLRRVARVLGAAIILILVGWTAAGIWFVHHPRAWIEAKCLEWPYYATKALLWVGNPAGDLTDSIGLTGSDAVQITTRPAPSGSTLFAGIPVRRNSNAPNDIQVLDRGEFVIGWSPSLRHPVWCAYHVPAPAKFEVGERPSFKKDKSAQFSPKAGDYAKTGYDRGHLAPNYAITSRFGPEAQSKTFLMSNVAPQTPSLNRGVWREIEHRIAELWTARYGEIWVIVGCISNGRETLSGNDVDVPTKFYQIVVAQHGSEVRALAVLIEQRLPWRAWPARYIVSIDEVERASGFDFLEELPDDIEDALESEVPTRLWPVRLRDVLRIPAIHNAR